MFFLMFTIALFVDSKVCGRDSDGGNVQNGCGATLSWAAVPNLTVDDLPLAVSSSIVDDIDINSTELHLNTVALHHYKRKEGLMCHNCKKQIYGARFECLTCPVPGGKQRCEEALCASCVLQIVKFNSVSDTAPLNHPACAALRTTSTGRLTCQGCGGKFNSCHGSYGYRSTLNAHWNQGTSTLLTDMPESPNPNFCTQECEDRGGTSACRVHKHHVFDIVQPPRTEAAASLLMLNIDDKNGEVSGFGLKRSLGVHECKDDVAKKESAGDDGQREEKTDSSSVRFNLAVFVS